MTKPLILSYYLPQYHPFKENDEWWGKGFTEWTNVAKARKYYWGHYQPKIPKDLGFYDLRVPEVRNQQALLASEAGVSGFCYWHYWFNGKKLMERPFEEMVETSEPNFPFCLNWANHSWFAKTWNKNEKDKLLIEQTYGGKEEYVAHFNYLLKAFKDPRYIKIDGKLVFGIFEPYAVELKEFMRVWNELAKENGLGGFHFFCHTFKLKEIDRLKDYGYNTILVDFAFKRENLMRYLFLFGHKMGLLPQMIDYTDYIKTFLKNYPDMEGVAPQVIPNFDHTPRSGKRGSVFFHTTPQNFQHFMDALFKKVSGYEHKPPFYMLKSWNEWGEGNYMEPDLKYGKGYIEALKNAIDNNFV